KPDKQPIRNTIEGVSSLTVSFLKPSLSEHYPFPILIDTMQAGLWGLLQRCETITPLVGRWQVSSIPEQNGGDGSGAYYDDRAYRYAQRQQQIRRTQEYQARQQSGARHSAGSEPGMHPDDTPYLTDEQ